MRRQRVVFDAGLFGSLLPAEAWDRIPKDRLEGLLAAAPSFRPLGPNSRFSIEAAIRRPSANGDDSRRPKSCSRPTSPSSR